MFDNIIKGIGIFRSIKERMGQRKMKMDVVYYVVFGLCYIISLLPFCVMYLLSDIIYLLVYYVLRYRRQVVRMNLEGSFPEKTAKEIVRIEQRFYHFFCDYVLETVKMTSISRKEMQRRMKFTNIQEFEDALLKEDKEFLFIYLGHYCNWEWMASIPYALTSDINIAQIYHPLYNKSMDRFFLRLRTQFGGECVPMKSTLRRMIELKREKRPTAVGFISDQLPKWNSIHFFVPFLNRETAVFTGAEQMGKKFKVAYFYADVKRLKRGFYECTFVRMHQPEPPETEFDMTVMYNRMLEQTIKEVPEYWLWTHKRWKRTKEEWLERNGKTENEV